MEIIENQRILDLGCGMGGTSLGFQQAGYNIDAGIDQWELATKSFEKNLHAKAVLMKLEDYYPLLTDFEMVIGDNGTQIYAPPNVVSGSTSCKDFSKFNRKRNIYSKRAQAALDFCRITQAIGPEVFVYENILNTPDWVDSALMEMPGYKVTKNIVDSQYYGIAQTRRRKFFIGDRNEYIQIKSPSNYKIVTVREAFDQITNNWGYTRHRPETVEKFSKFKVNKWSPSSDDTEWSGVFRLSWNNVSCVIPDFSKAQILHPTEDRIITVAEGLALQGFPQWYIPVGGKTAQAKMIGNAVSPGVSKAIALTIKKIKNWK